MIPARDSVAPGQLIPIVCKCQRLYLNSGSDLGLAGSRNPRWAGGLILCRDSLMRYTARQHRVTPRQQVSLLLIGLADTDLVR